MTRRMRIRIEALESRAGPQGWHPDLTLLTDAELEVLLVVARIYASPEALERQSELPALAEAAGIVVPDISWPAIGETIGEAIHDRYSGPQDG